MQAKRLTKRYASLKQELFNLVQDLKQNPEHGTPIGKNCHKIRIAIAAKGKGKSTGARIITNFVVIENWYIILGKSITYPKYFSFLNCHFPSNFLFSFLLSSWHIRSKGNEDVHSRLWVKSVMIPASVNIPGVRE